jgi:transcriptional regulator with XRE-family HTH domain
MFLAAWLGHTRRSLALAEAVREAIKACGWKEEYAARLMGLSAPQLSRQLAGQEPLNVFRLAELPDEFQRAYDKYRAGQRGAVVLEPSEIELVRGAAHLGRRVMRKMTLPQTAERRYA